MADSLLTSLLGTLDSRSVGAVAGSLGESEHSVMRGLQTSLTGILGCIASKCEDSPFLHKIYDLARGTTGDISWSQLAGGVSDPNSSLISSGKRMLGTIFGGTESSVATAVSAESGLRPSSTSWIMAMAAPMVLNFLGRRIRDEGLNAGGLGSMLQREIPAIRSALPASLANLFWPRAAAAGAGPVIAQSVTPQRSRGIWPAALGIIALAICLGWLFNRAHHRPVVARRPVPVQVPTTPVPAVPSPIGEAGRAVNPNQMGKQVTTNLNIMFDTGSSNLRRDGMDEITTVADSVKNQPNYHVNVEGYTDNSGDANSNMALSQRRVDTVVGALVNKGVPRDHITGEGHGEENPIADNSAPEGRAGNRRVVITVTPH